MSAPSPEGLGRRRGDTGTRRRGERISYVAEDAQNTRSSRTAQILGQAERISFQLQVAGFAADLGHDVAELRDAGGAHGMALGFEAARGVDRLLACARSGAGGFVRSARTAFDKTQIL